MTIECRFVHTASFPANQIKFLTQTCPLKQKRTLISKVMGLLIHPFLKSYPQKGQVPGMYKFMGQTPT